MCIEKVQDEFKHALLNAVFCPSANSGDHETHHFFPLISIPLNGNKIIEVELFMFNNLYENCSALF
jgi:hypothetical protein